MPTTRITAIAAAVVRRLSQSASSAPGSPRLSTSCAGLESTKIATIGQREEGERGRQGGGQQRREPEARARQGAGPKPASARASAQGPSLRPSTKAEAASGCLRLRDHAGGVGHLGLERRGQLDRLERVAGGVHVGHVDEAGVGGALGELADDPLHVGLVRADVGEDRLLLVGGQPGEHLARVGADRDRLRADRDLRPRAPSGPRSSRSPSPPAPRARRCWWRTPPACRAGPPARARPAASCWPPRRRPPERPGGSGRRARRSPRTTASRSRPGSPWRTTSSASVIEAAADTTRRGSASLAGSSSSPHPTAARSPAATSASARLTHARPSLRWPSRPRWRHAGRQPELLDRVAGDGRHDPVRAGLDLDERHHPVGLDRADHAREAVARRQRVAGAAACAGAAPGARPRARNAPAVGGVPLVRSLPARSQRRSVSWLTPIALAASPSSSPSLLIA